MRDVKAYIESGILELYVAGQLSEKENLEVARYADEYPEIQAEIIEIEKAILALTREAAPGFKPSFDNISHSLSQGDDKGIRSIGGSRILRKEYLGWAASFLLAIGTTYLYFQNKELNSKIQRAESEILLMEEQIAEAENSLEGAEQLLNTIRDKNVVVVALGGQTVSPESYAKAYWNKEEAQLFIDAKGLPAPPEGMAYQVWSLKLDPLSPTSVGLLEDFTNDDNGIFALSNPNDSQAFGITLEPEGGSEFPTLEQLYVLGKVTS
ncbi:anti-sigma factor domain-containing protein [Muriicola sp.]|uniref:anti-sigma factor n=1 Tax=Muriicola sp. TaxID=2020856 RepID=UPI00356803F2